VVGSYRGVILMEERGGRKGYKEDKLNCPGIFLISLLKKIEPKLCLKRSIPSSQPNRALKITKQLRLM